ncbi:tetrapyrrole methylase [Globomyces pollinis-pini]|nr:tetrapyrrole methylase [Globomyces pollinis-pini]
MAKVIASLTPNLPASSVQRVISPGASFMVGYQLKRKHVLVVGGGKEAANRTFFALESDAYVTLIAPVENRHPAVIDRIQKGLVRVFDRNFIDSDLDMEWDGPTNSDWPVDMVLGCIDDPVESRRLALLARSKRIPVNCADIPELCDFYFMAQYREGALQIAVSTNGGGPRLGARIRNAVVESLDPDTPEAVTQIGKIRERIRNVDVVERNIGGTKVIENRMGWVSRFCDSWNLQQLVMLKDPLVADSVIDAFRKGQSVPTPPIVNDRVNSRSAGIPVFLTSNWWCPSSMGYFAWVSMIIRYFYAIFRKLVSLVFLHLNLLNPLRKFTLLTVRNPAVPNNSSTVSDRKSRKEKHTTTIVEPQNNQSSSRSVPSDNLNSEDHDVTPKSSDPSISTQNRGTRNAPKTDSSSVIQSRLSTDEEQESTPTASDPSLTRKSEKTNHEPIAITKNTEQMEIIETVKTSSTVKDLESSLPNPQTNESKDTISNEIGFKNAQSECKLFLVGAGPGHPEMLTVQALELLKSADLVVSDRLIPEEIISLIPTSKLVLSSFKVGGASDKAQNESNEVCLKGLKDGKTVVRLKTGDPFVFGRGGEEVLWFRERGYESKIIPGLSSVFAGPTSVMIPVTHRGVADQVLLLSGRGQGGTLPTIPEYLATRTLIFLMSLSRLSELSDLMVNLNYPADLPCAVIEKATWKKGERVCVGNLTDIVIRVKQEEIQNPAMLVVGTVVTTLIE